MSSGHAVPFYCPYCGEEDLVPDPPAASDGAGAGSGHGRWACRSCLRAFRLSLAAIASPPHSPPPHSPPLQPPSPPVPASQAGQPAALAEYPKEAS